MASGFKISMPMYLTAYSSRELFYFGEIPMYGSLAQPSTATSTIVPLPQTPGIGIPIGSPKRSGILLRRSTPGQVEQTIRGLEQRQRQSGLVAAQERTYTVSEGENVVRHGLGYRPTGRIITLDTAGFVGDSDLSSKEWRFTVLSAGIIRVRWQ